MLLRGNFLEERSILAGFELINFILSWGWCLFSFSSSSSSIPILKGSIFCKLDLATKWDVDFKSSINEITHDNNLRQLSIIFFPEFSKLKPWITKKFISSVSKLPVLLLRISSISCYLLMKDYAISYKRSLIAFLVLSRHFTDSMTSLSDKQSVNLFMAAFKMVITSEV